MIARNLCAFFGLSVALAFSQQRPLDNIDSRQYQHVIRPLRLALDRWLQTMGLQEMGLSIRLVKASDLPENACGMSQFDTKAGMGEIDVLRSDEYANRPGCLDGVDVPMDQRNTVIHEVLHMVFAISVAEEAKVAATSGVIQPRTTKHK